MSCGWSTGQIEAVGIIYKSHSKMSDEDKVTFNSLGLCDELCKACESINWKIPTDVQRGAIPLALKGHDLIGVSQTGSGKTGAYVLPILNALYQKQKKYFALILTPTRELAEQVADQIHILGASVGIKCAVIIGGEDNVTQVLCLAKKPNVIIATPGRLLDHLVTTKGFRLDILEYLVFDEADRILNSGFEEEITEILKKVPKKRSTFLFSATMTHKVKKLQMVSLKDPVKVEISGKYETPKTLRQRMMLVPLSLKEYYLYYVTMITTYDKDKSTIIFCNTWAKVRLFTYMLRNLGITAVALYGQMTQEERTKALNKFKSKKCQVLVATDLVSRGLDIPFVDRVIIYDVPRSPKDYVHRVGRTARAGRSGTSYILCTEFELFEYIEIEELLGYKLEQFEPIKEKVVAFKYEVTDALKAAKIQIKEIEREERRNQQDEDDEFDNDDTEEATGIRKRLSKKRKLEEE